MMLLFDNSETAWSWRIQSGWGRLAAWMASVETASIAPRVEVNLILLEVKREGGGIGRWSFLGYDQRKMFRR